MGDNQNQNAPTAGGLKAQGLVGEQVTTQPLASPSQTWQGQVGLPQKEQEPIKFQVEKASLEAPEVTPELSEIGVKKVFDKPDLNLEDKKAGIQLANESVPVETAPTGAVKLPMTEEEAMKILEVHKRVADSVVWLATEIVKQFKVMHGRIIKGS